MNETQKLYEKVHYGLRLFILTICTSSVYADALNTQENAATVLTTGTQAKIIDSDKTVYPSKALRDEVEGWVIINFLVKKDGTTDDIQIQEASIEDYFDKSAIDATKSRIYKPATLNGKPVMEGNKSITHSFSFRDADGGVSKAFRKTYIKSMKAIEEDDLDLAKDYIDKLDGNKKWLLAEVCYLDMLKGNYFSKRGDKAAALYHIDRALVIADVVASEVIYKQLLRQSFFFNGSMNNFQASLRAYDTLLKIDKDLASDDPIRVFGEQVRQALSGETTITTSGEISVCATCGSPIAFWRRELNRKRFLIDQVVGEVTEIMVGCRAGTVSLIYEPELIWSVDQNWKDCSLRVFGEEGTTLRLVEYPNDS